MKSNNRYLFLAGICSFAVCILHIAVIIGGADWYRFFGAGEELALMAENGSLYPAALTSLIAVIFAIWSAYAFSGAGLLPRLPLIKLALVVISAVYLLRGLGGIPLVLLADESYVTELSENMNFMIVSSVISLGFGILYTLGTVKAWSKLSNWPTTNRSR